MIYPHLVDPATKEPLYLDGQVLRSSANKYPIIRGIPSFCDVIDGETNLEVVEDKWIESKATTTLLKKQSILIKIFNRISCSQNRTPFLERNLNNLHGAFSLEMGCGGGRWIDLYKKYSLRLVGMDPYINSLLYAKTRNEYEGLVHCTIEINPFPDNHFDLIISTDVLGHTSLDTKEIAYSEMLRILKPGGKMIHVIETDSTNIWIRTAKKIPELYQFNHIDRTKHIGMEIPSTIIERCEKIGFRIVEASQMHSIVLPVGVFVSWFDGPYSRPLWIDILLKIAKFLTINKYIAAGADFMMGFLEKPVNTMIPIDWTTGLLLCAEKKKE